MGIKSTIKVAVFVRLSVTSALEYSVRNNISENLVKNNLESITKKNAILVKAYEPTNPEGYGYFWHFLEYKYDISIDLYNIIKLNSNTFFAQISKFFKNKRKKIVMEKVRKGIEDGFAKNINSNFLNHSAVKLKNVRIEEY